MFSDFSPFMKYSSTDVAFLMHLESWSGHFVPLSSVGDIGNFLGKSFHLILPHFEAHGCFGLHILLWKSCQFVSPVRICITTVFVYFKQCK